MSASTKPARVTSVNVGAPRIVRWGVRNVSSAIWKTPVAGRVRVEGVNLAGDDQADGDAIAASEPPTHGLTLAEFAGASRDASRALLERIAAIDDVPRGWRDWARRQLVPSVTAVARDHGGEVCADYT
jgi:hypothetical protein